ncbi:ABC transporter permease [Mesorhizobium sp.]|uniref:ABC transporter permease n=1 Tax=Mesorhizobium sp. TaxID=1871066 RepID=UPI000FE2C217|nr:ABC transporter permease [Mesorhizobium sp.]RWH72842.1 MAG: ABC transporter permease [Mesorhizobium sp.]RWL34272.1 MAG: ABC transporter permease [Mesorhizobium sp.]RWL35688.1 MAG: ABC transporter permease [Mesorhizobium sp.]RWL41098.1 MAG: ABC transporter permease [Mesorhizobium sp.]RWL53173.1 MAG: ABC transporter permease [Mesorhizobium sp.]
MEHLANIFWLGTKELRSFSRDFVLFGFVVYSFTLAVYAQAESPAQEAHNSSVAIVDEDHSALSRAIAAALLPPYFSAPTEIVAGQVDEQMDTARSTFVLDIPPHYERDIMAGRRPAIQVNVDATAMMQAGIGAGYLQQIIAREIARSATDAEPSQAEPAKLAVRVAFNPNLTTQLFNAVMAIIGNVNMLAIILAGAAIIREREHGTMDHLLIMPLTPFEIAAAKVWANGLVITVAVGLSLWLVIETLLGIRIVGSIPLFMAGVTIYLFFATAIGIFLGTVARSMPQLGLLFVLVALPMNILSGGNTPLDSMPAFLRAVMQLSPSTHFVSFAQAILYRGAGIDVVWPQFAVVGIVGGVFFALSIMRFRRISAAMM